MKPSNKGNDSWAVREELLSINWKRVKHIVKAKKLLELNWKHVKQPVKAKKLPVLNWERMKPSNEGNCRWAVRQKLLALNWKRLSKL